MANLVAKILTIPTLQRSIPNQLINDNNNYVNLHDVTNLGLYNKLILVTQKQVLELYIIVIECKTLYDLCIPHTAFPNATRSQLKQQQKNITPQHNKSVHVTNVGTGT